jgi:hypothetical protein
VWAISERVAVVQALFDDPLQVASIRPQTWWRRRRRLFPAEHAAARMKGPADRCKYR